MLRSRKEELKSIIRYKQNPVCKPMYYTPDLWIHTERVTWLADLLCQELNLKKDISIKIHRYAMFHDDSEIIAGDIATPVKKAWTDTEKKEYEEKCANAIPLLVQNYGNTLGDDYESILYSEENKHSPQNTTDSMIHACIEYIDKLDALMETFHELYAGNSSFLNNMNKVFGKDMTCLEYILARVERRYSTLKELGIIENNSNIFNIGELKNINVDSIVTQGVMHSSKSIEKKSGIMVYDIWKQLHFDKGTPEHISYLYKQHIT